VLFKRPDLKSKARVLDDKSRWLFGDDAERLFSDLEVEPQQLVLPVRREFTQGGYYILGSDFETPQEVRIVADAGPLGFLSIAAHGHADALAVVCPASAGP